MKHLRYFLMAALVALPLTACDEDTDPVIDEVEYGTVTGTVSAEGTGLSGVAVSLVGPTSQSASTGAGGTYTFTNVEAGSYGVAIDAGTHADVSFSQTSKTTTISTDGQTATVDFSGSYIRTATITGVVTADGAPLGGVAVKVTGGPDNVTNNSVTNAGGEYFATGLRAGTFTVTITAPAGVTFNTTSAPVTVATGETKTAHFPGDAIQMATITGAVTVDNVGQAGVAVALSNTGGAVAATESGPGGAFSFMNVTPGTYTVTITPPAEATFDVVAKNVTVAEGDAGVVNFAGKGPEEPAKLSIQSITTGGAPIVLTNVFGQIEVTLNVTRGDRDLDHVDVLIDDEVVATQTFALPAPSAEAVGEEEIITLNVPTTQVRKVGDFYVPVVFNGGAFVSANLYEVGATAPIPSNEVPVVMNNIDALFLGNAALTPNTPSPSFFLSPNTWYTGNATFVGPQYLAYSTVVPTSVRWADAGTAGCSVTGTLAGSVPAGLLITNNYNCAGVEGTVIPNAVAAPSFTPAVAPAGPDGSTVVYPALGFSTIGAPFMLDNDERWFVIPPVFPASNPLKVYVDNKAPRVETHGQAFSTLGVGGFFVAFNDAFDQQWVNAQYPFIQDVATSDGGTGVAMATRTTYQWDGATSVSYPLGYCTTSATMVALGDDLAESIASDGTPDGYKLCATAEDNLGNKGYSLASNWFGVDKVAPTGRLHGTSSGVIPGPAIAGTVPGVSTLANTTIFNIAAPAPGTDTWGIEGLDSRSGFEATNAVPATVVPFKMGYPVDQRLTHTDINGVSTEAGVSDMPVVLTDTWVRTSAELPLLGNILPADPGYYAYKAVLTDRAGNSVTIVDRNYIVDQIPVAGLPTIAFLSYAQTFYAPGTDANFVIFGADDLEVINATVTMDYPTIAGTLNIQHTNAVGARWDGLNPFDAMAFTTAITGVSFTVPSVLGRYDFTCDGGAGSPYTSCAAVANTITPTVGEFNTDLALAFGDARDLLPVSSTPTMFEDAGGNLGLPGAAVPFNVLQWSDTTRAPWLDDRDNDLNQDLITWRIFTNGTSYFAEHMAPTSIEQPFFDATALVLNDAGTILTCGLYPAPVLTDNGVNRFWTYTLPIPGVTTLCGAAKVANPGATYHAVGILDNAALISQGI
jgi:hypothetical protein